MGLVALDVNEEKNEFLSENCVFTFPFGGTFYFHECLLTVWAITVLS